MIVQLKLFGHLRQHLPDGTGPHPVEAADGVTVAELLTGFGVPADQPRILMVNGRHVRPDHVLADGDVLAAFPPVAGG